MKSGTEDSRKSRRPVLKWLVVLVAVSAAGYGVLQVWNYLTPPPVADLPAFDPRQLHPQVTEAIMRAVSQIEKAPVSGAAWGNLGMICMAHGLEDQALACFDEATRRTPGELKWPYLAAILFESTDFEQAARRFAAAAKVRDNYAPLQYRWGMVEIRLGHLDQAQQHFARAAKLDSNSPYPQLGLGRVAMAEGEWDTARRHFEKAAQLAPWSSAVQRALIPLYTRDNKLDLALRAQQQVARMPATTEMMPDPIYQQVLDKQVLGKQLARQADQLFAKGDLPRAIQAYQAMIKARPDLARPAINLARAYQQQGNLDAAASLLRTVIARFPEETVAHENLAYVLEQMGDLDGAERALKNCISLKPDYEQALFALGLLEKKRGHADQALDAFQQAVESNPQFARAHLSLGLELLEAGQIERAIEHIERAVQLAPDDPVPQGYLKKALEKQKASQESTSGKG